MNLVNVDSYFEKIQKIQSKKDRRTTTHNSPVRKEKDLDINKLGSSQMIHQSNKQLLDITQEEIKEV